MRGVGWAKETLEVREMRISPIIPLLFAIFLIPARFQIK